MQILEQLRANKLFRLQIVTIPAGGTYRPVSQRWGRINVKAPKRVAHMIDLCDEYYEVHFDARELEALANDLLEFSKKLRAQT